MVLEGGQWAPLGHMIEWLRMIGNDKEWWAPFGHIFSEVSGLRMIESEGHL